MKELLEKTLNGENIFAVSPEPICEVCTCIIGTEGCVGKCEVETDEVAFWEDEDQQDYIKGYQN